MNYQKHCLNRLAGMIPKVAVLLLLLLNGMGSSNAKVGAVPSDLVILGIEFLESNGQHVPCKNNQGADLPSTQYLGQVDYDGVDNLTSIHNYPTAVVKSAIVDIKFTIYRMRPGLSWSGTIGFGNPSTLSYGGITLPAPPPQHISLAPGESTTLTFKIGPFPDVVKPKNSLIGQFSATPDVGSPATNAPSFDVGVYVVYAVPLASQVKPWLGVLDDACKWAEDKNTRATVAASCTEGLYSYNNLWPLTFTYTRVIRKVLHAPFGWQLLRR